MTRRLVAAAIGAVIMGSLFVIPAVAEPTTPTTPPTPAAPTSQLSPINPGTPGQEGNVDLRAPRTGGVQWDQFGGNADDAPTNLPNFIDSMIAWGKTIGLFLAMFAGLSCLFLVVIGIRGRSEVAKVGLRGLIPVFGGAAMIGLAATIAIVFVG